MHKIRLATPADLPRLVEIYNQAIALGKAFHGLLPVALPAAAKGLVLQFTPLTVSLNMVFKVDLGK